jgi:hypothetical protein
MNNGGRTADSVVIHSVLRCRTIESQSDQLIAQDSLQPGDSAQVSFTGPWQLVPSGIYVPRDSEVTAAVHATWNATSD